MRKIIVSVAGLVALAAFGAYYFLVLNANQSELDERWVAHDTSSQVQIDNSIWQTLLDDYLVTDTDSGVNLFDYEGLLDDGREPLDEYVTQLVSEDPLQLNRIEQKAYWINLYNAATVQLILDNYPVATITKLGESVTDFGPWNDISVTVNDIELSLNDIEHRIIRPLYDDYRIHFAVNCASIGCPNLASEAFRADSLDEQLDVAAADYLKHPRGVFFDGSELHLSTLFKWYATDFGDTLPEVLETLGKHTGDEVSGALAKYQGEPSYNYDWSLNGYCSIDDECG